MDKVITGKRWTEDKGWEVFKLIPGTPEYAEYVKMMEQAESEDD